MNNTHTCSALMTVPGKSPLLVTWCRDGGGQVHLYDIEAGSLFWALLQNLFQCCTIRHCVSIRLNACRAAGVHVRQLLQVRDGRCVRHLVVTSTRLICVNVNDQRKQTVNDIVELVTIDFSPV
jgi:urease gamma subunit